MTDETTVGQKELGLRQARLLLIKYELECSRHLTFEIEKEIETQMNYKSETKHLYAAKLDIIRRIKNDITHMIDKIDNVFMPDYYKI